MAILPVEFQIGTQQYRRTPWGAFRAVSMFGDLVAEFGDDIVAQLVEGSLDDTVTAMRSGSHAAAKVFNALLGYLGAEDLAERVTTYLTASKVQVRIGGDWMDLGGDPEKAGDVAAAAEIDGWDLLQVAIEAARAELSPLFDRLLSSVPTTVQAANLPSLSMPSEAVV